MHVVYEQNLHDEEVVIGCSNPQICALVAQHGPRPFLGLKVKKFVRVMQFDGILTSW